MSPLSPRSSVPQRPRHRQASRGVLADGNVRNAIRVGRHARHPPAQIRRPSVLQTGPRSPSLTWPHRQQRWRPLHLRGHLPSPSGLRAGLAEIGREHGILVLAGGSHPTAGVAGITRPRRRATTSARRRLRGVDSRACDDGTGRDDFKWNLPISHRGAEWRQPRLNR